jgi:hypothetical protein
MMPLIVSRAAPAFKNGIRLHETFMAMTNVVGFEVWDPSLQSGGVYEVEETVSDDWEKWASVQHPVRNRPELAFGLGIDRKVAMFGTIRPSVYFNSAAAKVVANWGRVAGRTVERVFYYNDVRQHMMFKGDTVGSTDIQPCDTLYHLVYVQLDGDVEAGRHLAHWPVATGMGATPFIFNDKYIRAEGLRTSFIGFRPDSTKKLCSFDLHVPGIGTDANTESTVDLSLYGIDECYVVNDSDREIVDGPFPIELRSAFNSNSDTAWFTAPNEASATGRRFPVNSNQQDRIARVTACTAACPPRMTVDSVRSLVEGDPIVLGNIKNAAGTELNSIVGGVVVMRNVSGDSYDLYRYNETAILQNGSGTFSVNETITGGTSGATAIIRVAGSTSITIMNRRGTFTQGETVTGGTSGAAREFVAITGTMTLTGGTGTFTALETITGGTSGATATVRTGGTTSIVMSNITGVFTINETITGGTSSAARTLSAFSESRLDSRTWTGGFTTTTSRAGPPVDKIFGLYKANATQSNVYSIDISDFVPGGDGGVYRLYIPGLGVSHPLPIHKAVHHKAASISAKGEYHMRADIEIDGRFGYNRPRSHRWDLQDIKEGTLPVWLSSQGGNAPNKLKQHFAFRAGWRTNIAATGKSWGWNDAGDWDNFPTGHLISAMHYMTAYELSVGDARNTNFNIPKMSEYFGRDDPFWHEIDHLPDLVHMALWGFVGLLYCQKADGALPSAQNGTCEGRFAFTRWMDWQPIAMCEWYVQAAEHQANYVIAGVAAKAAKICNDAGCTEVGTWLLDRAILAEQWASNIYRRLQRNFIAFSTPVSFPSQADIDNGGGAVTKNLTQIRGNLHVVPGAGDELVVTSPSSGKWMRGTVTSYNALSGLFGAMSLSITSVSDPAGAGPYTDCVLNDPDYDPDYYYKDFTGVRRITTFTGDTHAGLTTSSADAMGTKVNRTFARPAGMPLAVGARVRVYSNSASSTKWMEGGVVSFDTNNFTFYSDISGSGTGTAADWRVSSSIISNVSSFDGIEMRDHITGTGLPNTTESSQGIIIGWDQDAGLMWLRNITVIDDYEGVTRWPGAYVASASGTGTTFTARLYGGGWSEATYRNNFNSGSTALQTVAQAARGFAMSALARATTSMAYRYHAENAKSAGNLQGWDAFGLWEYINTDVIGGLPSATAISNSKGSIKSQADARVARDVNSPYSIYDGSALPPENTMHGYGANLAGVCYDLWAHALYYGEGNFAQAERYRNFIQMLGANIHGHNTRGISFTRDSTGHYPRSVQGALHDDSKMSGLFGGPDGIIPYGPAPGNPAGALIADRTNWFGTSRYSNLHNDYTVANVASNYDDARTLDPPTYWRGIFYYPDCPGPIYNSEYGNPGYSTSVLQNAFLGGWDGNAVRELPRYKPTSG